MQRSTRQISVIQTRLAPAGCTAVASFEDLAELGQHSRSAHRTPAAIGYLTDVDGTSDVGVSVAEEEGDFVDAFAGEKGTAGDRVTEAMHRWDSTMRDACRIPRRVSDVEYRVGRLAAGGCRGRLGGAESAGDIALAERAPTSGGENEISR